MPNFDRYTLRHFMATAVRRQKLADGWMVSREQRSMLLGHRVCDGSDTTAWYETFDLDFLAEAREATDAILREVDVLMTKRRRLPPPCRTPPGWRSSQAERLRGALGRNLCGGRHRDADP
jgi:hypothetical protein